MGNKIIDKIEVGPIPPKNRSNLWLKPEGDSYDIRVHDGQGFKSAQKKEEPKEEPQESKLLAQSGHTDNEYTTYHDLGVPYALGFMESKGIVGILHGGNNYCKRWDSFTDSYGYYHRSSDDPVFNISKSAPQMFYTTGGTALIIFNDLRYWELGR